MASYWRTVTLGVVIANCCATSLAQRSADCNKAEAGPPIPCVLQIDPPNWWTTMPAPMLLLKGEHLAQASFSFSDSALHLAKTIISSNGPDKKEGTADDIRVPELQNESK